MRCDASGFRIVLYQNHNRNVFSFCWQGDSAKLLSRQNLNHQEQVCAPAYANPVLRGRFGLAITNLNIASLRPCPGLWDFPVAQSPGGSCHRLEPLPTPSSGSSRPLFELEISHAPGMNSAHPEPTQPGGSHGTALPKPKKKSGWSCSGKD